MAWYKTGKITIQAGQTSVSATGTRFAANARVGDGLRAPDGEWYEIVNIASETVLGIFPAYKGTTVSDSTDWMIAPLQGYNKESADRLRAITDGLADVSQEVADAKHAAEQAKQSADAAELSEANALTHENSASASATSAANDKTSAENAATTSVNAKEASETARDAAEAAAATVGQTFSDKGSIDLSGGSYPTKPNTSSIWKVSVAGTIGSVEYGVNDVLVYSQPLDSFYKLGSSGGGGVTSVNGETGDVVVTKSSIGLGNVDNTSDANKPVSTAQQTELDKKVDKVTGKQLSTEDFTSAEKTKLSGVEAGATKNQTDAYLLNRTNHTGSQLASTISDLASSVRLVTLSGLSLSNAAITSADTILSALGKTQGQLNSRALSGINNDITRLTAIDVTGFGILRDGLPVFTGATTTAGVKGLVPAPTVSDASKVLSGAGTWIALPSGGTWGSITGNIVDQLDLKQALDNKLDSSVVDFAYIYPNGGTAASPANVSIGVRYTNTNPFTGHPVICEAQVLVAGNWERTGWAHAGGTGAAITYGVSSNQRVLPTSDEIVTIVGTNAVMVHGGYTGGTYPIGAANVTTPTPCRVRVWRVKA